MYCTDTDLLRWEPMIAAEAAFASQTLLTSAAGLSGTTLTIGAGSLTASRVRAGHVAVLSGPINGCFPIIRVDSASALTLSVMHEGLPDELAPVGDASSDLTVSIRTFGPQRQIVSELLTWMAGIAPGSTSASVTNADVLRKPCVLGTLHMIYNGMAAAADTDESADLLVRAELYERLYRRSLRSISVEIDTNGDGVADTRRPLRLVQFARI